MTITIIHPLIDIFKLGFQRVTSYKENKLKNVYSAEESSSLIYCGLLVVITKINQPSNKEIINKKASVSQPQKDNKHLRVG